MSQHVYVTDYKSEWRRMFESEAGIIGHVLGGNCVAVHHIGSTAVPGLAAKPIIDIMPVVKSLADVDKMAGRFAEYGYEYLGEFGISGRRYMRKGGDERTHQVHVFAENDALNICRHLAFRDYLRCHEADRRAYGALKMALADAHPYDIEAYCDGKDAFVKSVEAKALRCWTFDIAN